MYYVMSGHFWPNPCVCMCVCVCEGGGGGALGYIFNSIYLKVPMTKLC